MITYQHAVVDGSRIFYREAGSSQSFLDIQGSSRAADHHNNCVRDNRVQARQTDEIVHSSPTGTFNITVPMNSNDIVLVELLPIRGPQS